MTEKQLITAVPYAASMGVRQAEDKTGLHFIMPFAPFLTGSPGRLHGGAVAGLLEIAANRTVRHAIGTDTGPFMLKPINVTVDYLREGALRDTQARAEIVRMGRRIANVRVVAWQDDPSRPIATAQLNLLIDRS